MNFFMCHTQYYNLSSIKKRRYKRQKSVYLLFFLNIKKKHSKSATIRIGAGEENRALTVSLEG